MLLKQSRCEWGPSAYKRTHTIEVEETSRFTIPLCLQFICDVKKRRLGVNLVHAIQFEYFRERIAKVSGFQFHTHPGICAADGVKPQRCPDAHTASPITPLITSAQRKAVDWLGHQARCNLPALILLFLGTYYLKPLWPILWKQMTKEISCSMILCVSTCLISWSIPD